MRLWSATSKKPDLYLYFTGNLSLSVTMKGYQSQTVNYTYENN